jgi:UTP:GlnB (protein PII) uridylyltransferase
VLAVTMPNRPGALADVCEKLSANRVQISYLYSTTGAPGGKAIGIFKVQSADKAIKGADLQTQQGPRRQGQPAQTATGPGRQPALAPSEPQRQAIGRNPTEPRL